MPDTNKVRDAADAVRGLAEAVPLYQDGLQPAVKEMGSALHTVAKAVNVVLAPVSALVWGYEQIRDFVSTKVAHKLRHVPPENLATPKPNVAGPALESLRYTGHEEMLRDMYANLLAAAMDTRTAEGAHPAFVEIIRQLTPDEARILRLLAAPRALPLLTVRKEYKTPTEQERGGQDVLTHFSLLGWEAGCDYPDQTPVYLDNLCRLGLAEIPAFYEYTAKGVYDALENHSRVREVVEQLKDDPKWKASIERKGLKVTDLGRQFCRTCVISHDEKGLEERRDV